MNSCVGLLSFLQAPGAFLTLTHKAYRSLHPVKISQLNAVVINNKCEMETGAVELLLLKSLFDICKVHTYDIVTF